jgi:hypothetical protein
LSASVSELSELRTNERTKACASTIFHVFASGTSDARAGRMQLEFEPSLALREAVINFKAGMQGLLTNWQHRDEQACLLAMRIAVECIEAQLRDGELVPTAVELMRAHVVLLANALDIAHMRAGKRRSKADADARSAIVRLLMTLSDVEDEVHGD